MKVSIQNKSYFQAISLGIIIAMMLFAGSLQAQPTFVTSNGIYTGQAEIGAQQRVTLTKGFKALRGCKVRVFTDPTLNMPDNQYDPDPGNTIVGSTPSNNQNYILTTTLRAPTINATQINQTAHVQLVEYFDGLGRPLQTVIPKGSPQKKDIVTPVSYDDAGRVDRKFLPYVSDNNNGAFNSNAITQAVSFYQSGNLLGREQDTKPYSTMHYDDSPLNRLTGETGIGSAWENNPTAINYKTNNAAIPHWDVTGASPGVFTASVFDANSLYLTENIDEDGNTERTYTDKLGQTVRVERLAENNTVLRTAYIYDDFGLLRCVVPPKANSPADAELCYYYNYDHRKRLIEKRLPGADWIFNVYDKRDRIALWQDGVQRDNTEWHFQLYDALNRPVVNGVITTNQTPEILRNSFSVYAGPAYETWSSGGPLYGYTNQSFPEPYRPDMQGIRSVNWYDTYDFKQLAVVGTAYDLPPIPEGGTIIPATWSKYKGAITGSLEVVEDLPGLKLVTVSYYDPRRRLLCTVSDNHLGGRNNVFFGYTFNDEVHEKIETHYVNGQQNDQIVLITRYTYDHQGRLLEEKLKFNDEDFITINALEYNEIGDVINTYLHGGDNLQAFNQKIENTYNIRGWLRMMNNPAEIGHNLFALDLRYENPTTSGAIATSGRFNGNISQMLWNSKTDKARAYGFDYDPLNRLKGTRYGDGPGSNNNQNHFRTDYEYDANGNITQLQRNMDNTLIDKLSYSYYSNGNRLKSVTDASGNTAGYAPNTGQYLYDANANMTYDPSKKITVSYNPLNLPRLVEFDNNDFIEYTYTATGTKLRKTVTSWKTTTGGTTDYAGQFLYQDNELSCIFTPVGRMVPMQYNDETFWKHEYNLMDHLGNTRIVFAAHPHGQPELMQQTSYYPFGMTLQQQNFGGALNPPNKLLYNGKELQDDELAGLSLEWYDYGARFYDPQIGRWHVVDPATENNHHDYSPYAYVYNSPIRFIDPNGLDTLNFDESGKYVETIIADGTHVGNIVGEDGYSFIFADQTWAGEFTTDEFPLPVEMGGDGGKYNSIFLVPKETIDETLETSGVKNPDNQNYFSKYIYALKESRGVNKKMDYVNNKISLKLLRDNPYSLFITDSQGLKVAHDSFNYGNFLWGAGMNSLTIPYIDAVKGAHFDNMIHHWLQPDSRDDQISILSGYLYK